jgi:hypothetical protein
MLLVITGAGASYESSLEVPPGDKYGFGNMPDLTDPRLPLTDQLFAANRPFSKELKKNPRMLALVPELRLAIRDGTGLETALGRIAERAGHDVETARQLSAMRHYINAAIQECYKKWSNHTADVTAYTALTAQLRLLTVDDGRAATVVTFNYDALIDDATRGSGLTEQGSFDSYVDGPLKLIHLHGSLEWAYDIDGPSSDRQRVLNPPSKDELTSDNLVWRHGHTPEDGKSLYPALAIPVDNKTGLDFTCPDAHMDALQEALPNTDAVLCIGWRGAEPHFAETLKLADKDVPIRIASGPDGGGKDTVEAMAALGFSDIVDLNLGFVDLVNQGITKHVG